MTVSKAIDLSFRKRIALACARAVAALLLHAQIGLVLFGVLAMTEVAMRWPGPGLDADVLGVPVRGLLSVTNIAVTAVFALFGLISVAKAVRSSFRPIILPHDDE